MRCFNFYIFILLSPLVYCQDIYHTKLPLDESGKIYFQRVIEIDSIGSDELFSKTVSYLSATNKTFEIDSKNIDINSKTIQYRLYTTVEAPVRAALVELNVPLKVLFDLKVELKEARVRITFSEFYTLAYPSQAVPNPTENNAELWFHPSNWKKGRWKPEFSSALEVKIPAIIEYFTTDFSKFLSKKDDW